MYAYQEKNKNMTGKKHLPDNIIQRQLRINTTNVSTDWSTYSNTMYQYMSGLSDDQYDVIVDMIHSDDDFFFAGYNALNEFFSGGSTGSSLESQGDYSSVQLGIQPSITMSGTRNTDFERAEDDPNVTVSRAANSGYTWHHVADYDGTHCHMAFIQTAFHRAHPHFGACAQYRHAHGNTGY